VGIHPKVRRKIMQVTGMCGSGGGGGVESVLANRQESADKGGKDPMMQIAQLLTQLLEQQQGGADGGQLEGIAKGGKAEGGGKAEDANKAEGSGKAEGGRKADSEKANPQEQIMEMLMMILQMMMTQSQGGGQEEIENDI
jgi:hypothetical protein